MKENYVISLVVPVYNAQKNLNSLLEQLVKSGDDRLEIIFVDDGSTDKSLEILRSFQLKLAHMKVIYQDNHGAPYARNHGMKRASGKYIWFFDADDLFEDGALNSMLNKLEHLETDILIGNMKKANDRGKGRVCIPKFHDEKTNDIQRLFSLDSFPGNKIYKKSVIDQNGIFWSDVRIHQDLNFYLKVIPFCKEVTYVSEILYLYIQHTSNSISATYNKKIIDAVKSVYLVDSFYRKAGLGDAYSKELEFNLVKHIFYQVDKFDRMRWQDRVYVYFYFRKYLKRVNYNDNELIGGLYRKKIRNYMKGKI